MGKLPPGIADQQYESRPVTRTGYRWPSGVYALPEDTSTQLAEPFSTAEYERMISGQSYSYKDPFIQQKLSETAAKLRSLDHEHNDAARSILLGDLLDLGPSATVMVKPGFRCEWGKHIRVAGLLFLNFDVTIIDGGYVDFGALTFVGPGVHIYTASHPFSPAHLSTVFRPVRIGDGVFIGGRAVILPGITIGASSVVGAGAVVTKDVPPNCIVVGNPAQIIRRFPEPCGIGCKGIKINPSMTEQDVDVVLREMENREREAIRAYEQVFDGIVPQV